MITMLYRNLLWLLIGALALSCQTTSDAERYSQARFAVYASDETRAALAEGLRYGSLDDGIKTISQQVAKRPRDTALMTTLARLYLIKGRLDKAEFYAKTVKRVNYRDRPAKIILANIAYIKGYYESAKLILTQIGGARSPEREVLVLLAGLALQQGEDQQSIQLLNAAIKRHPRFLSAHMNLGLVYLKHQEYKLARQRFQSVLSMLPRNKEARLHLAVAEAALGQYDSANAIYRDLLSEFPEDHLVLFNMAVLKFRQKDYDASISYLQEYVELAPSRYLARRAAMDIINEIQLDAVQRGHGISNAAIADLTAQLKDADHSSEPLSFDKRSELNSGFVFTSVGYIPD